MGVSATNMSLVGGGGGGTYFCQMLNLLFSKFRDGNSKFGINLQKFHGHNVTILKRAVK